MGISVWQLLIILAIVLVLFGAKRLRGIGSDLGSTIKGFKKAMHDEATTSGSVINPAPVKPKESTHV